MDKGSESEYSGWRWPVGWPGAGSTEASLEKTGEVGVGVGGNATASKTRKTNYAGNIKQQQKKERRGWEDDGECETAKEAGHEAHADGRGEGREGADH